MKNYYDELTDEELEDYIETVLEIEDEAEEEIEKESSINLIFELPKETIDLISENNSIIITEVLTGDLLIKDNIVIHIRDKKEARSGKEQHHGSGVKIYTKSRGKDLEIPIAFDKDKAYIPKAIADTYGLSSKNKYPSEVNKAMKFVDNNIKELNDIYHNPDNKKLQEESFNTIVKNNKIKKILKLRIE